jgi:hypothetical protein
MYDFILVAGVLSVLALITLAIWKDRYWLRLSTIVVLSLLLLLREHSITVRARSMIWDNVQTGATSDGYAQGVQDLLQYCVDSSYFLFFYLAAVVAICARGFRHPVKK